ncbi:hypothetical protein ACFFUT_09595 [Pseudohalocynthiibacter aestuariivivens]|uniref:Uncharacterized protein n=1 Tax=Pseudohalocynthiibacter aestuariivivens TaxID=1591409 RepID=A0ABV5JF08_9RHOB|nr:hypothetical protein [Pseudohalocynthiibacter aestuariivivens]MBS9719048.1 hypothetical protein [Pseudohalocynthiibacter aestuariivivens]
MRTRSRSPKKAKDERAFPIRIRVKVPEDGYGRQYIEMQEWLLEHAGRDNFAWNSDSVPGIEASAFYFNDLAIAVRFMDRFGLRLVEWSQ